MNFSLSNRFKDDGSKIDNQPELHYLIKKGSKKRIQKLLAQGCDPNEVDSYGTRPIHIAVRHGQLTLFNLLLSVGAEVNVSDRDGVSPLQQASFLGYLCLVRLLLEAGADPNQSDNLGTTSLHKSAYKNKADVIRLLISHGADVNKQDNENAIPLHLAAFNGGFHSARALLENDDNQKQLEAVTIRGSTALHLATFSGSDELITLLCDRGANIEATDKKGRTPLHLAVQLDHINSVRMLLDRGASVTALDSKQQVPLDFCDGSSRNRKEIHKLLKGVALDDRPPSPPLSTAFADNNLMGTPPKKLFHGFWGSGESPTHRRHYDSRSSKRPDKYTECSEGLNNNINFERSGNSIDSSTNDDSSATEGGSVRRKKSQLRPNISSPNLFTSFRRNSHSTPNQNHAGSGSGSGSRSNTGSMSNSPNESPSRRMGSIQRTRFASFKPVASITTLFSPNRSERNVHRTTLMEVSSTPSLPSATYSARNSPSVAPSSPQLPNTFDNQEENGERNKQLELYGKIDRYGFLRGSNNNEDPTNGVEDLSSSRKISIQEKQRETTRALKWNRMLKEWMKTKKMPKKMRSRCEKGIPDCVRGLAWKLISSAENDSNYSSPDFYQDLIKCESPDTIQIKKDISRTFPLHIFFMSNEGHGQLSLFNVLKAHSVLNKERGYCQGMGFICALLLLYLSEEETFWVLKQLLEKYEMEGLYSPGMPRLGKCLNVLDRLIQLHLPRLHSHFEEQGVQISAYATPWLVTVFVYSLPFETVLRVWDLYLLNGYSTVYSISLALLKILEDRLLSAEFEVIIPTLKEIRTKVNDIKPDELIRLALGFKFKLSEIENLISSENI